MAVQGNDRRLKDATVHSKGIVVYAEDGEDKEEWRCRATIGG
jgi:hypothetical protein